MVDESVRRFLDFPTKNIALVSVDPSKRKTGGALLGDRIRNECDQQPGGSIYATFATRQSNLALSAYVKQRHSDIGARRTI